MIFSTLSTCIRIKKILGVSGASLYLLIIVLSVHLCVVESWVAKFDFSKKALINDSSRACQPELGKSLHTNRTKYQKHLDLRWLDKAYTYTEAFTKRNRSETYCNVRYWRKGVRYRVGATLYVTDKNSHHARISWFPVEKTCRRAKQTVPYLLNTSKTTCTSLLAVMLCEVVVSYPAPDRQKPPPRTQFLLSS